MQGARYYIEKLSQSTDLDSEEATKLIDAILEGNYTPIQISAILIALKQKGETIEEITAFANVIRRKALSVVIKEENLIDTCGTGGDSKGSFNVSTTVAILLAAAGYKVAKHGNRAITSKSGSADILEALGANINIEPEDVGRCIEKAGIGFFLAPAYHPSMKYVMPIRKELQVRTVFNILGPLVNPIKAKTHLLGVFDKTMVQPIIEVLKKLGVRSAYVVAGLDGMDEVTNTTNTLIGKLMPDGSITILEFNPRKYGFPLCQPKDLAGGNAQENAEITMAILSNSLEGPKRDIVCLNLGFAVCALEECNIEEGLEKANEIMCSGKGIIKLREFIKISNSFAL